MILRHGHHRHLMPLDRWQRQMVRDEYRRLRKRDEDRHRAQHAAVELAIWSIARRAPGWVEIGPTATAPDYVRQSWARMQEIRGAA